MSNSSLVNVRIPAYEGNFTYGRQKPIRCITIHHMAGVLSAEGCGNIFQQVGRYGSSNYGIGNDGRIGLYVDECNTSWCNSNWDSNCESVTIETSNCEYGGNWAVSDAALNSLIRLVADIAKRNNLGQLVKGQNLTWHSMFASTSCPGPYLISKLDYIVAEANKINQAITIVKNTIDPISVVLNRDTSLWCFEYDKIENAKSIKTFKKGDKIDNIIAIASLSNGSKYYMTNYSYTNNINNGFNIVDCDLYTAPVIKPEPEPIETPTEEPIEEPVIEPIKQDKKNPIIVFIEWIIKLIIKNSRKD